MSIFQKALLGYHCIAKGKKGNPMNGTWIAPKGSEKTKNLYFRARATVEIAKPKAEAKLEIAAESLYMVWVNGSFAGSGPARGSRSLNYFDSLEIGHLLRQGKNTVCVLVQCMNIPTFVSFPIRGALMAEIEGITKTGDAKWEVLPNGGEWREDVEIFCCQTGFMEWRDLRKEPQGWLLGEDSSKWEKPELIEDMGGKRLLPRPVPQLAISERFPNEILHLAETPALDSLDKINVAETMTVQEHLPVSEKLAKASTSLTLGGEQELLIEPPKDGRGVSITFGFGREIIGFFQMEIEAPEGCVADIAYDETLENGRLLAARHHYKMADRVILPGGPAKIGSLLHERGFRMVEVSFRNFKTPLKISGVKAIDRRYPVSGRGGFASSDISLNKVWEICAETLSCCATDVFNDCPWRERSFWVNDLIVENVAWMKAFGDPRLNAHALRLAMSNIRKDGWLPGVCPDSGDLHLVLLPTNLFVPTMLKDYFLHSGDLSLVKELLPGALKLIELVDSFAGEDGIVQPPENVWNFFDWSYGLNKVNLSGKRSSLLEWLRCLSRSEAAWLLERCGETAKAKELRAKIPSIAKAAMKSFWPEGAKRCSDWLESDGRPSNESSQLTHALAIVSGTLPEERKGEAIEALNDSSILIPELYLHSFVFQAMLGNGMERSAIDRIKLYWGKMAESGTPTLWEADIHKHGKEAFGNAGSLCHGFGSYPIAVLQEAVLGVKPLEGGFKLFSFAPKSCGLKTAKGSIPTPSGEIRVSWSVENGTMKASIEIPQGLEAQLPDGSKLKSGKHEIEVK